MGLGIEDELIRILIRERPAITAYARSIVFSQEVAEEIYQNTAVVALRKKDEVTDIEGVMGWLLLIARFEALATLRRTRKNPRCFDDEVLDLVDRNWLQALEKKGTVDRTEALHYCLGKLTDRNRKILHLRYSEGISGTELAQRLGGKVDSCYVALSRIHKMLRECIESYQAKSV